MEFPMPVRIRWDVDFGKRIGGVTRIARAIREASPLVVELRIGGEKGLKALPAILDEIYKAGICVEATLRLSRAAVSAGRWHYPVGVIWAVDGERSFADRLPPTARAVAFTPDEETLPLLPEVLGEFAGSPAQTLHLPNINAVRSLAQKGHVPVPRPEQVDAAARRIAADPPPLSGKRLAVHDVFLWKALRAVYPEELGDRVEFSGCQAGTAVGFVDWEGSVYPCDALPVRLGTVAEDPLEKIWTSPARARLLESIRGMPAPCAACGEATACRAGCRGLAHAVRGTFAAPDPSCPLCGASRNPA